jgi:hypothetical protein
MAPRQPRGLASGCVAGQARRHGAVLLAGLAIPLALDPALLAQYAAYLRSAPMVNEPIPTAANWLRWQAGPAALAVLPLAGGVGWAVWRWARERVGWRWREALPALLVVSLATAPYAWTFDLVVLLPAIVQVIARLPTVPAGRRALVLGGYALLNVLVLGVASTAGPTSSANAWIAPASLGWWMACRQGRTGGRSAPSATIRWTSATARL